jgi:hypothetical protein
LLAVQSARVGATGCDSSNGGWYYDSQHLLTKAVEFYGQAQAALGQCGDLVYADQSDSIWARWTPDNFHVNDWHSWYLRSRDARDGSVTVPETWFQQVRPAEVLSTTGHRFLFSILDDAAGFNLSLQDTSDAPNQAVPPPTPADSDLTTHCYELCAQLWRHIKPPILDSVRLIGGNQVAVSWQNQNAQRTFDETQIVRNGVKVGSTVFRTQSFTDGPLSPGTYTYRLLHTTMRITGNELEEFAQPASDSSQALAITVPAPPPLQTSVDGEDLILTSDVYTYQTFVSGGVGPFQYRWTIEVNPYPYEPVSTWEANFLPPLLLGIAAPSYDLPVNQFDYDYLFRLTDTVSDAAGQRAPAWIVVWVFGTYSPVVGRGAAAGAAAAPVAGAPPPTSPAVWVRREDGACAPVLPRGRARQEWLLAFFRAHRVPQRCDPAQP